MKKNDSFNKSNIRQSKKEMVLRKDKKGRTTIVVFTILALVAAVGAGIYLVPKQDLPGTQSVADTPDLTTIEDGRVTYAVSQFDDGKARHFSFTDDHGGITIRYFIVKSTDGVIRAAFDACDVCWPAGKGYYQEGESMVCRNCGRKFATHLVNEVKGGCNPAPLMRTIEGERLVLFEQDIIQGRRYFNFKKKA